MDSLKGTLTPMKVLQGTLNGGIAYGTFNYNELENKPSINGTELVGNVNIDIPTKTSDLTNDSGFITDSDVPTKTSDLTNDSGFITDADIPTKTSELTNDSGFITSEDIPEIPTNTSQLNNDSGFLTINTTPVRSVNSLTGDVNLFIPNATSQLTNDTGFITDADVPTKTSDLTNDSGFLTMNTTPPQTGTIENVAIASFSDGADNVPVSELIVDIEARQDLHGYDKPWIGGAGKNKLPNTASTSTIEGVTFTVNDDGSITASGTSTGWTGLAVGTCTLPAGTYKVSSGIINEGYYYEARINNNNYNTANRSVSIPFTLEEPTVITVRAFVAPNYSINNITGYPMITIESESDLTYEPYSNICPITGFDSGVITVTDNDQATNNYTVDFGQTLYGGYLNVTTGVLTITHTVLTFNGSENWSTRQSGVGTLYELNITEAIKAGVESISNMYVWEMNLTSNNTFRILASGNVKVIAIHDDNRTDLASFKTFFSNNNLTICCELATPIEIQLTPVQVKTLLNNNNIFANTGNIEKLVYFKTGCEAIAKLIEAMIQ